MREIIPMASADLIEEDIQAVAIVGAGAVVTWDCPFGKSVVGNPARERPNAK